MFDGSTQVMVGGSLVNTEGSPGASEENQAREPWQDLHRRLRSVAKRRGALDHEELALIREAIAIQIWRELGMVSIREYLEHVMGYTPGVASERVRVAEALDAMPALDAALDSGDLSFSAVRAITRIATRKTERAWLAACRGKAMRQIEELLAEREPGDRPESPRKPDLRLQEVRLKLPPHVVALQREARKKLEAELGERIDDAQLYEAAFRALLRGGGDSKKAPTQIAISVCSSCKVARQRAGNVEIAIAPSAFERATCDAQWLGNIDNGRARAVQDITPAVRQFILTRDKYRCRVPGCRSSLHLDVHHIIHQAAGGSHEPSNLITLCDGHHTLHHDGLLSIQGTADALEVVRIEDEPASDVVETMATCETIDTSETADEIEAEERSHAPVAHEPADTFHVENPAPKASDVAAIRADATNALTHLGYRKDVAARAVQRALDDRVSNDLESLIRSALQRCG